MKPFIFVFLFSIVPAAAMATTISIPAQETNRDPATIIAPDNLAERSAWPVVLLLHGYTGSGDFIRRYFGLEPEVNKRGFILVVPNGRRSKFGPRYWNATDACCDFDRSKGDDVKYLTDLLEEVANRLPVDPKRIYAAGHSNGGFMAHRLACDTTGLLAGIASFAGVTYKNISDCKSNDPISMLQIHAVDDGTVRFAGNERGFPGLAAYPGSETTVARWTERNGCNETSENRGTLDLIRSIPNSDAEVQVWNKCANKTQVAFWKIRAHNGDGHNAHTPSLSENFGNAILTFLLEKKRD